MTMPVEIKELVIRAIVSSPGDAQAPAGDAPGKDGAMEAMVEAAVKEVLRILKASKER
jgi:hypothetical protein